MSSIAQLLAQGPKPGETVVQAQVTALAKTRCKMCFGTGVARWRVAAQPKTHQQYVDQETPKTVVQERICKCALDAFLVKYKGKVDVSKDTGELVWKE